MVGKPIYLSATLIAILSMFTIGLSNNIDVFAQTEPVVVSVVPGSTTLTTDAYSPNPVEVTVGTTVQWVNDDTAFHTVTSGSPGAADVGAQFDSGLAGPSALTVQGKTFEHTFNTAGEFDYFCTLHPNMVGTVIVT